MPFQKPRILTDSEANYIRGKCLMNDHPEMRPTAIEVMQLIGHFDLLVDKYQSHVDQLRNAIMLAINTVECASLDRDYVTELPWYTNAKTALRETEGSDE